MVNLNVNINMENLNKKNKAKPNKGIVEHTQEVLRIGMLLGKKVEFKNEFEKQKFINELASVVILHDIGKCTKKFQKYLEQKSKGEEGQIPTYKHNLVSWYYINHYLHLKNENMNRDNIESNVLYHHFFQLEDKYAKVIDKQILNDNVITLMNNFCVQMFNYSDNNYNTTLQNDWGFIKRENDIKKYDEIKLYNGDDSVFHMRLIVRSILQFSDRFVSSYNGNLSEINDEVLERMIEDRNNINECVPQYSDLNFSVYNQERLDKQKKIINDILVSKINTHIIPASAGYGKTLMGLLWFFQNRKKMLWVTARTVLAEDTYNSVIADLKKMNCNDSVKVCLYLTGVIKKNNYTTNEQVKLSECDIILTIIDNDLSFYNKNNVSDFIYDTYTRNVVFDEYHEFNTHNGAPLFSEFINQIQIRTFKMKSQTLLLSATPLNFNNLIGLNEGMSVQTHQTESYGGDTKVNIEFIDKEDILKYINNNMFYIIPTVCDAQNAYDDIKNHIIKNKINMKMPKLFHGDFNENDKIEIKTDLTNQYGKESKEEKQLFVCTPLLDTGLNVSTKNIIMYPWNPNNVIQVLGRANRFKEIEDNTVNLYLIDSTTLDENGKTKKHYREWYHLKENIYNKDIAKNFITELKQYDGQTLTKDGIYDIYKEFMRKNKKVIDNYYTKLYEDSMDNVKQITLKRGCNIHTQFDDNNFTLQEGMNHRGYSDDVWIAVPCNENKQGFEKLQMNYQRLQDEENKRTRTSSEKAEILNKRFKFMKGYMIDKYSDEAESLDVYYTKGRIKYDFHDDSSNVFIDNQKLKEMAKKPCHPIYLPYYEYTSEYGKRKN